MSAAKRFFFPNDRPGINRVGLLLLRDPYKALESTSTGPYSPVDVVSKAIEATVAHLVPILLLDIFARLFLIEAAQDWFVQDELSFWRSFLS